MHVGEAAEKVMKQICERPKMHGRQVSVRSPVRTSPQIFMSLDDGGGHPPRNATSPPPPQTHNPSLQ